MLNSAVAIAVKHIPGWIPGMQFKRLAKQWHDTLMQMVLLPHQFAKEEMVRMGV